MLGVLFFYKNQENVQFITKCENIFTHSVKIIYVPIRDNRDCINEIV